MVGNLGQRLLYLNIVSLTQIFLPLLKLYNHHCKIPGVAEKMGYRYKSFTLNASSSLDVAMQKSPFAGFVFVRSTTVSGKGSYVITGYREGGRSNIYSLHESPKNVQISFLDPEVESEPVLSIVNEDQNTYQVGVVLFIGKFL